MAQTIKIAQITGASGTIGDIEIDKMTLGGVTIGTLTMNNTSIDMTSGSALAQNVRVVMQLHFFFNFSVDIFVWSDSDSLDLGSLNIPVNVGNLTIPSLSNIPLSIPSLVATKVSAVASPLVSVNLGGGSFSGLNVTGVAVPQNGFTLAGMAVGAVSVSTVQVPQTAMAKMTLQDFRPTANIVIPSVTMGPIQLPSATAPDIQATSALNITAIGSSHSTPTFTFGPVSANISVVPTAFMSIGALTLTGVSMSGSIAQAIMANIGMTVDISGINMSNMDIGQLNINNLTM